MVSEYGDEAGRAAYRWKLDKRGIVAHDGLEVFGSVEDHPVEFARHDDGVTRDHRFSLKND
jgi:hypothetical protein